MINVDEHDVSQGKHGRDRGELEFALNAAAHDGRRACVGAGQEFRGHRGCGTRAKRRHTSGVHDGERRAVGRIGQHDRTLDRRQPPPSWVV